MQTILQLNEFFVEGKNPNKSHVLLNITEPSTEAEKQKGYFFAICELNNADNKYIMRIQEIVDEIENKYYEHENNNNSELLEEVLNQINKKASSVIKDNINLNIVTGAVIDNQIIFSFFGNPQVILFYQNKQGTYKIMDLVEQNQEEKEDDTDKAIFSQIIEGKISERDYLFVGTQRILDYFSHDRLQKIICSRPPRQSSQHLQRVLSELKNGYSFGGIMMHLQKKLVNKTKVSLKQPSKGTSAKSLRGLFNTHSNTANILSPSILPKMKTADTDSQDELDTEEPENIDRDKAVINSSHLRSRPQSNLLQTKLKSSKNWQQILSIIINYAIILFKYLGRLGIWLVMVIITLIKKIGIYILELFLIATNIRRQRREILERWKTSINQFKVNIGRLPIITKILFIAGLVLIIVFTSVVYYLRIKQNEKQKLVDFDQTIQQIKSKQDTAESYLIFDEETKAFTEIKEASAMLSKLDCVGLGKDTICNKYKEDLDSIMNKVRKMYTVEVSLLTDWGSTNTSSNINRLAIVNKNILNFNDTSETINTYDLLSKVKSTKNTQTGVTGFKTADTPKENDYTIFIGNNNELINYNPKDDSWKKEDISYPNDNNNIKSAFVYSRRLYLLDGGNNQIYRHDPTTNGFGKGKEWITDNSGIDFAKAVSLAIDGDLFVLNSDGIIYKFANGQKQDYSLSNLDPQLDNADELWTYYEMKYLYILDSKNKRLIIINKTDGTLKKQLTAKEFSKPTGMIIDEPNSTAYITDSGKLYQMDLNL